MYMVCLWYEVTKSSGQYQSQSYCDQEVFFYKQKKAYEMRISDWSSDVCSSDLDRQQLFAQQQADDRIGHQPQPRLMWIGAGEQRRDRKSVVSGMSVSVRVDLGGLRIITNKI